MKRQPRQIPDGPSKWSSSGMAQMHADFSGWNDLLSNMEPLMEQAVQEGIAEGLEFTKVVAQELVPEDTGKLHDSAKVEHTNRPGLGAYGTLTFSATNPRDGYNYAWMQEVNETYDHPKPGAQAHYLRDALDRTLPSISIRIKKAIRQANRQAARKASSAAARSRTNVVASEARKGNTIGQRLRKLPLIGRFFGGRK